MDRPILAVGPEQAVAQKRFLDQTDELGAVHRADDERREQSIARAIVDHLQRCGVRWSKKPPAGLHGKLE